MNVDTRERLEQARVEMLKTDGYFSFDYADLLRAVGLTIVSEDSFGSYQGDIVFHVRDDAGRDGLLVQGYGSCSGCDALAAAQPSSDTGDLTDVAALADQIRGDIVWAGDDGMRAALNRKIADKSTWWAYSDDEALQKVRELARAVDET